VPPGDEAYFSERVVRLTGGQWCWSPPLLAPAVAAAPCLASGYVTLGVVGRSLRLGPQFLTTLAAVMAGDPTLRVCFIGKVCGDQGQRLDIEALLSARGVATDRVSFAPWTTRAGYWYWLATVDVVLDTCPASGGLSLLDALWMGVPVVTCLGTTSGSRQAASVLTSIGLDRWVAKDPSHMVQRTLGLTHYPPNLQAARLAMRERLQQSPLLNGQRVARQIEKMVHRETKAFRQ
jgi:predicted O-linked N-acetylglucosamine transferase (SPINDLY family)